MSTLLQSLASFGTASAAVAAPKADTQTKEKAALPDYSAIGVVGGYARLLSESQCGNVVARLAKVATANAGKLPADTVTMVGAMLADIDASRVGFTARCLKVRKGAKLSPADEFVATLRVVTARTAPDGTARGKVARGRK